MLSCVVYGTPLLTCPPMPLLGSIRFDRFVLSDPGLKELFNADYCVTELGGASIPDFKLQPTLSFFQSTAEKGKFKECVYSFAFCRHNVHFPRCCFVVAEWARREAVEKLLP